MIDGFYIEVVFLPTLYVLYKKIIPQIKIGW